MAATDLLLKSAAAPAPIIYSPSSSSSAAAVDDCGFDNGCSICLEPFSFSDPAAVTKCKHEYHLQCILEWSQRSKECPICSRQVVLEDPTSQELLGAVQNERPAKSSSSMQYASEIHENTNLDDADDSDFEEQILRHFAAFTDRARSVNRRIRQTSPGVGPAQVRSSAPVTRTVPVRHQRSDSSEESQVPRNEYVGQRLPPPGLSSNSIGSSASVSNVAPTAPASGDGSIKLSESPRESSQRSGSSELLAFSESIKSKLSAASARYKETFSKNTRGFKEKLLARNTTVKELGKEVKQEMSSGIAGLARMIERLDLSSKRASASGPLSSNTVATSSVGHAGESVKGNATHQYHESASKRSSNVTPILCSTIPDQTEVSVQQGIN